MWGWLLAGPAPRWAAMTQAEISGMDAEFAAFKAYARLLYSKAGVTERLLTLQDGEGADINLVLFCCYQAVIKDCALDMKALERMSAHVADWREGVILPMRSYRRQIKQTMLRDKSLSVVYDALLIAEIEAEHAQQAMLVQCEWGQGPKKMGRSASENEKRELVQTVLMSYFRLLRSSCDRKCVDKVRYIAREAVFCSAIDENP